MDKGLTLRNVAITKGGVPLLSVDHHIAPGEVLTVMGPSGVGKSTLLAFITGTLSADFKAQWISLAGRARHHPSARAQAPRGYPVSGRSAVSASVCRREPCLWPAPRRIGAEPAGKVDEALGGGRVERLCRPRPGDAFRRAKSAGRADADAVVRALRAAAGRTVFAAGCRPARTGPRHGVRPGKGAGAAGVDGDA